MPINEEYIFTYEDYLAIKYHEGLVCVREGDIEYKLSTGLKGEKKIHQKHDKSFKDVLSNRKEMAFFLNEFVGIGVYTKELQEYKNEFITKQYRKKQSDIIYKNIEKEIYYMVEHQSIRDVEMPYRIAEYCLELIENAVKNSKSQIYPTIVPIVLYTGKGKWNVETNFAGRQKFSEGIYERYKIDIKYTVVDINTIEDMELLEKQDYLANVMLLEKCGTDEEKIEMLKRIEEEMKSKEEQEKILYYFVNVYGRTLKLEDKKRLDELLKRSEDKMTVFQQTMIEERKAIIRKSRAEGRTEGRKQGRVEVARNLLKLKMSIEQIIEATGLSKEEIEKLAQKLNIKSCNGN